MRRESRMKSNDMSLKSLRVRKQMNYKIPNCPLLAEWVQSASKMIDAIQIERAPMEECEGSQADLGGDLTDKENARVEEHSPAGAPGVASPSYLRHFKKFVADFNPSVVGLLETRVSGCKTDTVVKKMGYPNSFRIEVHGFSGGIWLLSQNNVQVMLHSVSNQFVHFQVQSESLPSSIFVTVVYAGPHISIRRNLWPKLAMLDPGSNNPWVLGGDFNAILNSDERIGGAAGRCGICKSFNEFIFDNSLTDIGFEGSFFTWARGSLRLLLDRCLANEDWVNTFPESIVLHLDRLGSDHRPILLQAKKMEKKRSNSPFRFLFPWQEHPNFMENTKFFGAIGRKKKELTARLRGIDRVLATRDSTVLQELERHLKEELDRFLEIEEDVWFQKSRSNWILHGDRNTFYFHACAKSRRRINTILSLKLDDGSWCSNQQVLQWVAVDYFRSLFTSGGNAFYSYQIRGQVPRISSSSLQLLGEPVTDEEIKNVIFEMHPFFYQKNWEVVGPNVCRLVKESLYQSNIPAEINRTLLVLIPKVANSKNITQFRPISLCSVVLQDDH
ncbi:uncharacterized protein LOC120152733 [Hibiscus syriacus]|uniref:uncharacterized protein LOC120152733 n=1 Tax=Hibiscus syriacus TaxID=106335 RepID=UPI00192378A3|nr:uncharacterized protein LOC120152733 [Hibiscus syriacus]